MLFRLTRYVPHILYNMYTIQEIDVDVKNKVDMPSNTAKEEYDPKQESSVDVNTDTACGKPKLHVYTMLHVHSSGVYV